MIGFLALEKGFFHLFSGSKNEDKEYRVTS